MSYAQPMIRRRQDPHFSDTKRVRMVTITEYVDRFEVIDHDENVVETVKYTPGSIMSHLQAHHRASGIMEGWNMAIKRYDLKDGKPAGRNNR